jgi:type IV pilus assembly protein PilA
VAVQAHIEEKDALPHSLEEAGIRFAPTPHLRAIELDPRTAALTLTLGFPPLEGRTIVLAPRRDADRNLTWSCFGGTAPPKYLPRSCRGR